MKEGENEMFYDRAWQINDGLRETASCGNAVAYDPRRGLIFAEYMTGEQCMYGESSGKIRLAVFPPNQPWNVRRIPIAEIPDASRGFLCNAVYRIGDGRVRVIYTRDRGERIGAYFRDYDFVTDVLSEEGTVFLRTDGGDVNVDNGSLAAFLASRGYACPSGSAPIVNKVTEYGGEFYTALTLDGPGYPVLCRIEGNVLCPFAVVPAVGCYEFRYYVDESGIRGVNRGEKDDPGAGKITLFRSADGGVSWESELLADGIQSRPDILPYFGKPLVVYNFMPEDPRPREGFPPMHHHRNAVRFLYDGKELGTLYSKYGIVEHETVSIAGDLYMLYSDSAQALMQQNHACWAEEGLEVENGKEKSNWVKLGYFLGTER